MNDGVRGAIDETTSVVENTDLHLLWKSRPKLLKLLFNPSDDRAGIRPPEAQNQSFDDFTLAILADGSIAGQCAHSHLGNIRDGNGYPLTLGNDDRSHIFKLGDSSLSPNQQGFLSLEEATGPIVPIVDLQCIG